MKRLVPSMLLVVAASAPGASPLPKPDRFDRRTDLEKLQGVWWLSSAMLHVEGAGEGRYFTLPPVGRRVIITGRVLRWYEGDNKLSFEQDVCLGQGDRQAIDLTSVETGRTSLAIYKSDGETLTIRRGAKSEDTRPSSFDKFRAGDWVWEFRRKR